MTTTPTASPITTRLLPGNNPVLLIHGFASNAHNDWETTGFCQALNTRGRGALLVGLPGHTPGQGATQLGDDVSGGVGSEAGGQVRDGVGEKLESAPAHEPGSAPGNVPGRGSSELSLAGIVTALADAAEATGAAPLDVVGYSLGARLAWALAIATPVRRLVLGGLSPTEPFGGLDVAALGEVVAGRTEASDPMQGMLAQMVAATGPDTAATLAFIGALSRDPFDPTLGTPTAPTLFLSGEADPMSQGIEAVVATVPGARFQRVPGDHQAALASPEFRDATLAFLS